MSLSDAINDADDDAIPCPCVVPVEDESPLMQGIAEPIKSEMYRSDAIALGRRVADLEIENARLRSELRAAKVRMDIEQYARLVTVELLEEAGKGGEKS